MHHNNSVRHLIVSATIIGAVSFAFGGTNQKSLTVNSKKAQSIIQTRLNQRHELFVQNKGQWNSEAKFLGQSPGVDVWLDSNGMKLDYYKYVTKDRKTGRKGQVVNVEFANSNKFNFMPDGKAVRTQHYMAQIGHSNAVAGSYNGVLAKNVYNGIDLHGHYVNGQVEYDWIVNPNANPSNISLDFVGSFGVVAKGSKLSVKTQVGEKLEGNLVAYQLINGKKVHIPASFSVNNSKQVSFKLGSYDHTKALVIDPVVYGTYFGGNDNWDDVRAVVTDTTGGVYLTGMTRSTDYPITAGPYFTTLAATQAAYITKLQGDAYNVDYSAYFGSNTPGDISYGQFIQLDPFGNVWVAGVTTAANFDGAATGASATTPAIFLVRFQQSATTILDPVTQPANYFDVISNVGQTGILNGTIAPLSGFAIIPNGNPTSNTPVTLIYDGTGDSNEVTTSGNPANNAFAAGKGFIVRLNYDGTTFTAVTSATQEIGEGLPIRVGGLAIDNAGDMYITGQVGDGKNNYDTSTVPNTFITTPNVFTGGRLIQKNDLFARRYDPSGNIVYSAIIGGADNEATGGSDYELDGVQYTTGSCVAIDADNNVYITGVTNSFDYPRTRGVFGEIFDGTTHDVVTKISADFTNLLYSTSLNTMYSAYPAGIAVDSGGNAYVTGLCPNPVDPEFYGLEGMAGDPPVPSAWIQGTIPTGSNSSDPVPDPTYDFPTTPDDPTSEGFLMVLNPSATALVMGTYLGGKLDEHVFGPYVDSNNDVWVPGSTCANRIYELISSTGNVQIFEDVNDGLPASLITSLAFKSSDLPDQVQPFDYDIYWYPFFPPYIVHEPQAENGPQWLESRDGFLVKMRIGQPVVNAVTITPSTLPGGLGESATVNVTLSSAAPAGGASITLSIDNTAFASFSPNSAQGTQVVNIPAGATTLTTPVTIYSEAVSQPQTAIVTASYGGSILRSPLHVVPWLANFSISPVAVVGGNSATGTITLAQAAPSGGVTITLSTTSGGLVSFPNGSQVTVPAGSSSTTFTINTAGVDATTNPIVNASLLGETDNAQLTLNPAQMVSVSVSPNEIQGGQSTTGTVILNGAPGPHFPTINLSIQGSPAGFVFTPVTLNANSFTGGVATFTITTPALASSQLEVVQAAIPTVPAGYGYQTQTVTTNLLVDYNAILEFIVNPLTANPGDTITGTVTLQNAGSPSGVPVALSSSNPSLITVPASVTVPGNLNSISFPITVNNIAITQPTTVVLSAILAPGAAVTQTVTVNESTLSLSTNVTTVLGGNTLTGTVSLGSPAATDLTVNVTFSPNGVASVTTPVTIAAGSTSTSFTINTTQTQVNEYVTMTATVGSLTASANFTVTAPAIRSIAFLPASARGGSTVQCLITLDAPAPAGGAIVTLTSSNSNVAFIPTTVTIPAGQTSYQFSVLLHRVSRPLSTTVSATLNGVSVTAVVLAHR